MGIARGRLDTRTLLTVGFALALVYIAYLAVRSMGGGGLQPNRMGYLILLFFVPFLLERPRYGLYLLCFTLLLVPFWVNDQYFRLLSTNTFFVLFPLALLAGDLAHQRKPIVPSAITILLAFACAALLVGVERYGMVYLHYPQILVQATLLFFLGLSLFRTRQQLVTLILVLAVVFTLRNTLELIENWNALQAGSSYSTIRIEEGGGFFHTLSTGQSAFRGFMVPIFIAMFLYVRRPSERILLAAAIVSSAAWIEVSGARVGTISLVAGIVLLMWRMPMKRYPQKVCKQSGGVPSL